VFDTEGEVGTPGVRYDLEAFQVKEMEEDLGILFLDQRPRIVVEYVPAAIPVRDGEVKVWIANGTGNPFLPPKVTLTRVEKGETKKYEVDNPVAKPHMVKRTMHGGFKFVKKGERTEALQPLTFEFPPFRRFLVSISFATWHLQRDAAQELHHHGKMRPCVAPRDYEPNSTWPLADLQAYARLLEPPQLIGREDLMGLEEEEYETPEKVNQAREILANALFFVLLDDINTPKKKDFQLYLEKVKEAKARAAKKSA
jgi:hypothetical protein